MRNLIAPRFRPSFTLVELLVAIAIIGAMAGMVMFSLAGAQTDANITRTRGTIGKINSVILQEWEKFRYRAARVDVPNEWLRPITTAGSTMQGQPPLGPRAAARLKLVVLRDQMRMELPDRLSDILYPPTIYKTALFTANNRAGDTSDDQPAFTGTIGGSGPGIRPVPGKYNNYRERVGLTPIASPYAGSVVSIPATPPAFLNPINQPAEWLYQIVASSNSQGGNALESFRSSEIGDTDEDGMPEFIDGWGNPIRWLRWPAGYPSVLNTPHNPTTGAGVPDAMDPVRTDWRWSNPDSTQKPWLLVPLIISAGPDGAFDISFDQASSVTYATQPWGGFVDSPAYKSGGPYLYPDPYFGYDAGAAVGTPTDTNFDGTLDGAADNITNYDLILE